MEDKKKKELNKFLDEVMKEKVVKAEALRNQYIQQVIASKKELEHLEEEKVKVRSDIEQAKVKAREVLQKQHDNIMGVLKKEGERIDEENRELENKKKDVSKKISETNIFNLNAKAAEAIAKDNFARAKKLKTELGEEVKKYNKLLLETTQQKIKQDNDKKEIDNGLVKVKKRLQELNEQEKHNIEVSNKNIEIESILKKEREGLGIDRKEIKDGFEELETKKAELKKREERAKKKEEIIKADRTAIQQKDENIKKLQAELGIKEK